MTGETETQILQALNARAAEALGYWGLAADSLRLLKYRENAVFRIHLASGEPAVLRLHRPGYHGAEALSSEIRWIEALRKAGLDVPAPIATIDGRQIVTLADGHGFGEQNVDVVSWMTGSPLGASGVPLAFSGDRLATIFQALGADMARLHAASDAWTLPADFCRPAWDAEGLLGEKPLWGRFWDCEGLSPEESRQLTALRRDLRQRLESLPKDLLDYGLIHADLVRENVLVNEDGQGVSMIDFDDGGFGWRMFDLATALFKNRSEPDYVRIKESLVGGYRSVRPLSDEALAALPLFMALRALTYIGWIGERMDMPDAEARMKRYVADALALGKALR